MKKYLAFTLFLGLMMFASHAAADAIYATPVSGTSNLDFGVLHNGDVISEGLNMEMDHSTGEYYQVRYEVYTPFVNEDGEALNTGVIKFHTVYQSNNYGNLFFLNETNLNLSGNQFVLYESSQGGNSDDFQMIYTAYADNADNNGTYHGVIRFSMLDVATGREHEVYLDVDFTIQTEPIIIIEGSTTPTSIHSEYNPLNPHTELGNVHITLTNNPCNSLTITQVISHLPVTGSGYPMAPGGIQNSLPNETSFGPGPVYANMTPAETLIHSTSENTANFYVYFQFNPEIMMNQAAGLYQTEVLYLVNCDGVITVHDVTITFLIVNVFTLSVFEKTSQGMQSSFTTTDPLPDGHIFDLGQDMAFNDPNNPPVVKEIVAVIFNNSASDGYALTQKVQTPLTHTSGSFSLPSQAFKVRTQGLHPKTTPNSGGVNCQTSPIQGPQVPFCQSNPPGTFPAPSWANVLTNNNAQPLYGSNNAANSAAVRIQYIINPPAGTKGGDYFATFVYTASQ